MICPTILGLSIFVYKILFVSLKYFLNFVLKTKWVQTTLCKYALFYFMLNVDRAKIYTTNCNETD